MTQTLSTMNWQRTTQNGNYVASQLIDAAVDLDWQVTITTVAPDSDRTLVPAYLTVDNSGNGNPVTITYGPLTWITHEFERQVFRLPGQQITVQAHIPKGQATLYFSEQGWVDPSLNQYAIQQAAVPPLSIPVLAITGNRSQLSGDNATQLAFSGVGLITYSLRDTSGGAVITGFFSFVDVVSAYPVSIVPFGAQQINQVNAPLILQPGESGLLTTDGANWYFTRSPRIVNVISVTGSRAQTYSDNAGQLVFNSASAIAFSLRDLTTTSLAGIYNFVFNIGSNTVTLSPAGTQKINGLSSLVLKPGQRGLLTTDGSNWFWAGDMIADSAEMTLTTFNATTVATFAHLLIAQPRGFNIMLRCKVADSGYSIGDEIDYRFWVFNGGAGDIIQYQSQRSDATNIYVARPVGAGFAPRIANKTTGASAVPTAANWAVFTRAWL